MVIWHRIEILWIGNCANESNGSATKYKVIDDWPDGGCGKPLSYVVRCDELDEWRELHSNKRTYRLTARVLLSGNGFSTELVRNS